MSPSPKIVPVSRHLPTGTPCVWVTETAGYLRIQESEHSLSTAKQGGTNTLIPSTMVSVHRYIRSIYRVGFRAWWRQLNYIGDAKSGRLVGADQFGNRYYENYNAEEEVPGRQRWVDLAQHHYHASQVPPEWHSWISHIRKDPPNEDAVMVASRRPWQQPWTENLTGTQGAYKPYNTVAPKIDAWEPKSAPRA